MEQDNGVHGHRMADKQALIALDWISLFNSVLIMPGSFRGFTILGDH
jgi:hypothetical protein